MIDTLHTAAQYIFGFSMMIYITLKWAASGKK